MVVATLALAREESESSQLRVKRRDFGQLCAERYQLFYLAFPLVVVDRLRNISFFFNNFSVLLRGITLYKFLTKFNLTEIIEFSFVVTTDKKGAAKYTE